MKDIRTETESKGDSHGDLWKKNIPSTGWCKDPEAAEGKRVSTGRRGAWGGYGARLSTS